MERLLWGAATLIALGGTANAADLAARTYTNALGYNWTGLYIGGFVGDAFRGSDNVDSQFPVLGFTQKNSGDSFFGGGQVGYNYQFAPNFVLGIEGDIGGLSRNDRTLWFFNLFPLVHDRYNWLASVTGRLGYTWGPYMIHARGGVAFRDNSLSVATSLTSHRDDTGYTIGGGLEYMFAPTWSAKIEYQYYDFGRTSHTFNGDPLLRYKEDLHTVKAGINYHFNWGAPVAARY